MPPPEDWGVLAGAIEKCRNIDWRAATFECNGITVHYAHSTPVSSPLPKLVFVHGLTDSFSSCLVGLSELAEHFNVFAADNRGHGFTHSCPVGTFTLELLVRDTLSFIDFVSPNIPVFLVGHSMGGSIAANVSKAFPHRVKYLALEDPPWWCLPGESVQNVSFRPSFPGKKSQSKPFKGPFHMARDFRNSFRGDLLEKERIESGMVLPPLVHGRDWSTFQLNCDGIEPTFLAGEGDKINVAVLDIKVPVLIMTAGHFNPGLLLPVMSSYVENSVHKHFPGEGLHVLHVPPNLSKWATEIDHFFLGDSNSVM